MPCSNSARRVAPRARLWRATSSSPPTSVVRSSGSSSLIGLSMRTHGGGGRRRPGAGGRAEPARDEAPADDLDQPAVAQRVGDRRRRRSWRGADPRLARRRHRGGQLLRAPSRRATSSIRSASRVTSSRRQCGTVTSRPSSASATPKPSASSIAARRGARDLDAEQPGHPRVAQPQRRPAAGTGVARTSIVPRHQARAGELDHQPGGDGLRLQGLLGLQALLVATGGLGAQPQPRRRAVDVRAVPGRDLHQHARGVRPRPRSARRPSRRRSTSGRRRRR